MVRVPPARFALAGLTVALPCLAAMPARAADEAPVLPRVPVSVSIAFAESARPVVEYDDVWQTRVRPEGVMKLRGGSAELLFLPAAPLELAVRLGAASAAVADFPPAHARRSQSYDFGPSWGVGIRPRLGSVEAFGVSFAGFLDFDWIRTPPGVRPSPSGPFVHRSIVEHWQFGLRAERRWSRWGTFAGARWSDAEMDYRHNNPDHPGLRRLGGFEATRHLGALCGASWSPAPRVAITASADVGDRTGGTVGASWAF
jgi:hypothetical protein